MKRNLSLFISVLLFAGSISCTVYRNIPIEVLQTEEVKLDSQTPMIALIYRNFKYDNDTLQDYFLLNDRLVKERNTNRIKNKDSIVVSACLKSVLRGFESKKPGSTPVVFPLDLLPRQTGERLHPLTPDLVQKLARPAQADYIIFLETLSYFFSQYNGKASEGEFQEVKMAGMWSLHKVSTGEIIDKKFMTDTLFWDNPDEGQFPPRLIALQQAAELFGENYAKRFYPDWVTVDRLLIIPPLEDFRLAGESAEKQEWEQAERIWLKYADQRFGRLAVSACYNLALAGEISDDLEGAVQWSEKANELARIYNNREELQLTTQYLGILKKRLQDIRAGGTGHSR